MVTKFLGVVVCAFLLSPPSFGETSKEDLHNILYINQILTKAKVLKRSGAKTVGHMALIFERTGELIENDYVENIYPEVHDWAFDVSVRLRNVALMHRDVGMIASVSGNQVVNQSGFFFWNYYWAFWTRQTSSNPARRVAIYDASRFKHEQYAEIRTLGVKLRHSIRQGK